MAGLPGQRTHRPPLQGRLQLQCAVARRGNRHLFVAVAPMQGPILGANEASSPYAGCTGLHFGSTTAALLALTTINKCLIFLEREKSIGRLLTSRQPTTASR